MFIGHFGVGFAGKKFSSSPSLGTLIAAAQFVDLLWPFFVLLGIEQVKIEPGNTAFTPLNFIYYPFSHSLAGVLIWGVLFGAIYYVIKKNIKASILLALLVVSHWLLDFLTHRPDLPLGFGGGVYFGLGLWNSVLGTFLIESSIFVVGLYFYVSSTKAKNKLGSISLWSLAVFLYAIYLMNLFSPPPPNTDAIGFVGIAMWLLVAWGYWIDRSRTTAVVS